MTVLLNPGFTAKARFMEIPHARASVGAQEDLCRLYPAKPLRVALTQPTQHPSRRRAKWIFLG